MAIKTIQLLHVPMVTKLRNVIVRLPLFIIRLSIITETILGRGVQARVTGLILDIFAYAIIFYYYVDLPK
jgi:hypothetical protein